MGAARAAGGAGGGGLDRGVGRAGAPSAAVVRVSMQRANVVLHARAPFPPQAGPLLDDVLARVTRAPIYDGRRTYHVFLCDSPSLFALFAPWNRRVGGVTHVYFGGNAFLRPPSLGRARPLGPPGD